MRSPSSMPMSAKSMIIIKLLDNIGIAVNFLKPVNIITDQKHITAGIDQLITTLGAWEVRWGIGWVDYKVSL